MVLDIDVPEPPPRTPLVRIACVNEVVTEERVPTVPSSTGSSAMIDTPMTADSATERTDQLGDPS